MLFEIIITESCNINCKYCFEGKKENNVFDINNISQLTDFVKEYVKYDFVYDKSIEINFNGGEALIQFYLLKTMVQCFENEGINKFSLSTNLILANDEILQFLNEKKFSIQVSIDGNRKSHDLNRIDYQERGTFDKVLSNILLVQKKYTAIKVTYSMLITPSTVSYLSENVNYLLENNCKRIVACYCIDYQWTDIEVQTFKNELQKVKNTFLLSYNNNEPIYFSLFSDCIDAFLRGYGKYMCGGIHDQIGIKANGDILFCGTFFKCKNENDFFIGNIKDGLIIEKVNELLKDFMKENDKCRNCELNYRCYNKCFAINNRTTFNPIIPPGITCEMQKTIIMISDEIIESLVSHNNVLFNEMYKEYIK